MQKLLFKTMFFLKSRNFENCNFTNFIVLCIYFYAYALYDIEFPE